MDSKTECDHLNPAHVDRNKKLWKESKTNSSALFYHKAWGFTTSDDLKCGLMGWWNTLCPGKNGPPKQNAV